MQHGLTLIELMISITLGMLIVAAGLMVLVSTKSTYVIQDENARLSDTGRYAVENIARSIRQTGFENLETDFAPIVHNPAKNAPNIDGFDARTLSPTSGSVTPIAGSTTVNGSDVLRLRFFGTSRTVNGTPTPDGSVINCAGIPVGAVQTIQDADEGRGWSIFFVNRASGGEPQLFCAYVDATGELVSTPIASGVESFQVLYGLDLGSDGIPDQFVNATTVGARWRNVAAVKIAILVRGGRSERADVEDIKYELFGPEYPFAATDVGSLIDETNLPQAERARSRKIFSTVIQLRNRASGANIAPIQ
ncbi:MAG: PilW family protein [Pseudomonadota bacterium]